MRETMNRRWIAMVPLLAALFAAFPAATLAQC